MNRVAVVPYDSEIVAGGVFVSTVQVELAGPAAGKVTRENLQAAIQSAAGRLLYADEPDVEATL